MRGSQPDRRSLHSWTSGGTLKTELWCPNINKISPEGEEPGFTERPSHNMTGSALGEGRGREDWKSSLWQ